MASGYKLNTVLVERFMKENKLTMESFCKNCKIAKSSHKKFFSDSLNITLKDVLKIARYMKVKLSVLILKKQ